MPSPDTPKPRPVSGSRRLLLLAAPLLIAAIGALWLATVDAYGMTWDERVQARYGELALDYFASFGRDRAVNDFLNLRFYGPAFEMAAAAVYRLTNWDAILVRHIFSVLAGLAALAGLLLIARFWRLPWMPLVAVLALVTLPRFYGHVPFNSKDIPFAAAFTWAMAAIAWLLLAERRTWRHWLLTGAAIGAALALRMGGLLLPAFLFAAAGWRLLQLGHLRREWLLSRARLPLLGRVAAATGTAWLVMIIAWPWAHANPFLHPWQAFRMADNFSSAYPVQYRGEAILSSELPSTYLAHMLSITTPPAHLLLLLVGIGTAAWLLCRQWRSRESLLAVLALLWLGFPILYVIATNPNIYDGIRHFLFILPAAALLAALAPALVAERLHAHRPALLAPAAAIVLLLLPVPSLLRLHPYQMTYYNRFVGGLEGAWRHYETDYWSSSYREAAEWLNTRAAERPADDPLVVLLAANTNNQPTAQRYLDPAIELHTYWPGTAPPPPADSFHYYVALNRYGLPGWYPELPVAHIVGRQRAVFTLIRQSPQEEQR